MARVKEISCSKLEILEEVGYFLASSFIAALDFRLRRVSIEDSWLSPARSCIESILSSSSQPIWFDNVASNRTKISQIFAVVVIIKITKRSSIYCQLFSHLHLSTEINSRQKSV
ncbi:hypothetical protein FF38_00282 [Lucilia cuprina]|uniref:Uncharacterized protein n=1 Tax=Lucilia cuprina TaxID=7375 RepID=A0A0L0BLK2_LUCCU|nr:hypothetical protein FF38_00282 [Lucilia cuprina]